MPGQIFAHTHRVTYGECTIGNHVYYSRYLDILEEARGEFFRALGATFQQWHDNGILFPVIEAHLRYRGAARYDDVLRIEIRITELARVRMKFGYRLLNAGGRVLIEGETAHACAGTDDKLKRLPEELLEKLRPYAADETQAPTSPAAPPK